MNAVGVCYGTVELSEIKVVGMGQGSQVLWRVLGSWNHKNRLVALSSPPGTVSVLRAWRVYGSVVIGKFLRINWSTNF